MATEPDPGLLELARNGAHDEIRKILRNRSGVGQHQMATIAALRERMVEAQLQALIAVANAKPPGNIIVQDTRYFEDLIQSGDHRDLWLLTPRKFEELVAEIWSRLGYEVELTAQTRDGGRDIIAIRRAEARIKVLIECKRFTLPHKVSVDIVRALLGVKMHEGASTAILATTSSVSRDAQKFVDAHEWELEARDHKGVMEWIRAARGFVQKPDSFLWTPDWEQG